jgi:hypothetical protein
LLIPVKSALNTNTVIPARMYRAVYGAQVIELADPNLKLPMGAWLLLLALVTVMEFLLAINAMRPQDVAGAQLQMEWANALMWIPPTVALLACGPTLAK